MKSMKLSDYFKVVHPTYTYLKLIPDTSIRNYNSSSIAKSIHNLQKSISQRIHRIEKQFVYETTFKCSYLIDIYKNKVDFIYVVPVQYLSIAKEKIREVWPKITIEEVDHIKELSPGAMKYQLSYKNEDAFSLQVDKKSNEPLNNILNVLEIMQDTDRVTILYNFTPTSQGQFRSDYKKSLENFKANYPITKEKFNVAYIGKIAVLIIIDLIDSLIKGISELFGEKNNSDKERLSLLDLAIGSLNLDKNISENTNKKKNDIVLNTQMMVFSESSDKDRKINNALAVCQSYGSISGDNELTYKRVKANNINIENTYLPAERNKLSVNECSNLLQIPGRELLDTYKLIEKIDTFESEVPEELQKGVMCVGDNQYKGKIIKGYLSIDKNFKYLTLCLIGPTRAGKTTLISNLSRDAVTAKETVILFDFCGNCELSDEVSEVFQADKILNIDCSDIRLLQGFGYNEIQPKDNSVFDVYKAAKMQTNQLCEFINSINDNEEFTSRMERVLESAALISFIQGRTVKDVFNILLNHAARLNLIKHIPEEQFENLSEYIVTLQEIDEWSRGTKDCPAEIVGTKISYTQGILSRINKLKKNVYVEQMLKKDCTDNINLIEEMQKCQLICIKMPETMFSTETEKDIYCTYWLTKIWSSLQFRKYLIPENNRVKVNIIFDELSQIENCEEFLRSKLSQIAKFGAKPIISCHYLDQIRPIRNELKAANTSYMMLSGCDKANFNEMKEELYPYILEDLLNLKRYHSLNLIKYENGWAKFISRLPGPIKVV